MPKLTIDDLKKIKEEYKAALTVREGGAKAKITVHMGTCGITAGARKVMEALLDEMNRNDVKDVIVYRRTGSETAMQSGRDHWWHDLLPRQSEFAAAEPTEAR